MKVFPCTPYTDSFGYDDFRPEFNGEYNLILYLIKPETTVFDVGANVGMWSEYVLSTRPGINLYAFEPVPQLYEIVRKRLSKFDKVKTHNLAMSEKNGSKAFYYYDRNIETSGLSSFYRRPIPEAQQDMTPLQLEVKTKAIDSFCEDNHVSQIDFLKVDTEGAELEVLRGAEALLEQKRITGLQFEYGGTYLDAKITLKHVLTFLWRFDYKTFRILPDSLLHIGEWRDSLETYRYSNYLAIIPNLNLEF